jgi:hypothetical protein
MTGVGAGAADGAASALPRILNMTVPQVGHLPLIALRPFFISSSTPLAISFLALHLTQYPSAIKTLPSVLHARTATVVYQADLRAQLGKRKR